MDHSLLLCERSRIAAAAIVVPALLAVLAGPAFSQDEDPAALHAARLAERFFQDQGIRTPGGGEPSGGTEAINRFALTGWSANHKFGSSVANAGDFDGDGYDDVVVGAPGPAGTGPGRAHLYFGRASLPPLAWGQIPAWSADQLGYSVAGAGDLNGDGYDDIVVGSPTGGLGGLNTGYAPVFFGGPGRDTCPDVILYGYSVGDKFATSLDAAGDVNGDGYADLAVGVPGYGNDSGAVWIYYGGPTFNDVPDVFYIGGLYARLGIAVAGAGDVNADGFDDVVAGWGVGAALTGAANLYLGAQTPPNTPFRTFYGEYMYHSFGSAVSTAGDVNGDGFDDILIGAPGWGPGTSYDGHGRAYVFLGGASMNTVPDVLIDGPVAGASLGYSVACAGDVDADGYSDVMAGVPSFYVGGSTGEAAVCFGGVGMDATVDMWLRGESADDQAGFDVAGGGDIDGDGIPELIAGAPENDAAGSSAGRAYVFGNTMSGPDIPDAKLG
ncbi:MAG: FG-GAP-like repeat-containing protein, partial [Bacteroidota bacterium]